MRKIIVFVLVGLFICVLKGEPTKFPIMIELKNKKNISIDKIRINTEKEKRLFDYVYKNAVGISYKNIKVKWFNKFNILNIERIDNSAAATTAIIAVNKTNNIAFFLSDNNISNLNRMIEIENLTISDFSDKELKDFVITLLGFISDSFQHFSILDSYKNYQELFANHDTEDVQRLKLNNARYSNVIKPITVTRIDKGALVDVYSLNGDTLVKKVIEVDKKCKIKIFDFILGKHVGPSSLSQ